MGRDNLWLPRDGEPIAIKDMEDDHLCNTIRYMDRRLEEQKETAEMPMDSRGQERYFKFLSSLPGDHWPIYYDMVKEAKRRGLNPYRPTIVSQTPTIVDFSTPKGDSNGKKN